MSLELATIPLSDVSLFVPGGFDAAVDQLRAEIDKLPFELGPEGPWVAGGAVTGAVLGWQRRNRDLDVVFASPGQRHLVEEACRKVKGSVCSVGESEFATLHWRPSAFSGLAVDFADVCVGPLPDILRRFDLSVCRVATDGEWLYYPPGVLGHLQARVFQIMRPTTPERVTKYLGKGLGIRLRSEHQHLAAALWRGEEAPPLTSNSLTRAQMLGMEG